MKKLAILSIVFFIFSCNQVQKSKSEINGLWLVKKVKIGENEMTPVARWMKFNNDSTQTSGNGWLQHSVGTWSLKNNSLSVKNTNGLLDEAAPFKVEIQINKMTWSREEEGENVQVFLEKTDKLPTSNGNKLIGLWKIDSIIINDKNVDSEINPSNKAALHLRWDNTYVFHNLPEGKKYGVYKIHGHKPELQMVDYGDNSKFNFYKFSLDNNNLELISTSGNKKITLTRIHQFPQ